MEVKWPHVMAFFFAYLVFFTWKHVWKCNCLTTFFFLFLFLTCEHALDFEFPNIGQRGLIKKL